MLGTSLGNYRVTERLGEGSMGVVYVGRHEKLGHRVVVKVLRQELSSQTEIVRRFFNEAQAATAIRNPGIVQVFDFGITADGHAYFVMELLEGETLAARLKKRHHDSIDCSRYGRQVANVLQAAHTAGITHRDLKPDNLFLVADPEVIGGERVKVLDFGIAKLTGDLRRSGLQTRTGMVMGTPRYMSPEQCRGANNADARSDVYALGCILFEIACGRPPFVFEGIGDVVGAHLHEQPPHPQNLVPGMAPGLSALIAKMLAKHPNARPQTMTAVAQALDDVLHTLESSPGRTPAHWPVSTGAPPRARPPTPAPPVPDTTPYPRTPSPSAVPVTTPFVRPPTPSPEPAVPPRARPPTPAPVLFEAPAHVRPSPSSLPVAGPSYPRLATPSPVSLEVPAHARPTMPPPALVAGPAYPRAPTPSPVSLEVTAHARPTAPSPPLPAAPAYPRAPTPSPVPSAALARAQLAEPSPGASYADTEPTAPRPPRPPMPWVMLTSAPTHDSATPAGPAPGPRAATTRPGHAPPPGFDDPTPLHTPPPGSYPPVRLTQGPSPAVLSPVTVSPPSPTPTGLSTWLDMVWSRSQRAPNRRLLLLGGFVVLGAAIAIAIAIVIANAPPARANRLEPHATTTAPTTITMTATATPPLSSHAPAPPTPAPPATRAAIEVTAAEIEATCQKFQTDRKWPELQACADKLAAHDPARATELRTRAAEEVRSAPLIADLKAALAGHDLKRAKTQLDQIWTASVDYPAAKDAYDAVEKQAIRELALALDRSKDGSCGAYTQLLKNARTTNPGHVATEAARWVTCTCDADVLEKKAVAKEKANDLTAALAFYDKACLCNPNPRRMLQTFLEACNVPNLAKAKAYWKLMPASQRSAGLNRCVRNGITEAALNAP